MLLIYAITITTLLSDTYHSLFHRGLKSKNSDIANNNGTYKICMQLAKFPVAVLASVLLRHVRSNIIEETIQLID